MVPPVRLTVCDFYLTQPKAGLDPTYSEFRGAPVTQVPVLRIFGSTLTGVKACLHVHGVFPYLYVPFEGNDNPFQQQYLIANGLDKALNISMGQTNSATRHVFKIVLVSGIPFYGYHEREHQFFKIYLFNPNLIKKSAELLLNGSVMGRTFQPHESHLPFTQQFMVDYNLQGMHLVHLANILYRRDPQEAPSDSPADRQALEVPAKVSTCAIEADVYAEDILNRHDIHSSQEVVNPGLAALWEDEHQRRRIQGKDTQPTPLSTQQRNPSGPSTSEDFHRCRLFEKLTDVEQSDDSLSRSQNSTLSYPAEAPEGLMNASFVELHSSRQSSHDCTQNQSFDTQDEQLLDLLVSMAESQETLTPVSDAEEAGENEEQNHVVDSDNENEVQESVEMSQPFIAPFQQDDDSDDDSFDNLFNDTVTLQSLEDKLQQLDGVDDASGSSVRRRRLGARRIVQSKKSTPSPREVDVTKQWLMSEVGQVLEMPAIDQIQQSILHDLGASQPNTRASSPEVGEIGSRCPSPPSVVESDVSQETDQGTELDGVAEIDHLEGSPCSSPHPNDPINPTPAASPTYRSDVPFDGSPMQSPNTVDESSPGQPPKSPEAIASTSCQLNVECSPKQNPRKRGLVKQKRLGIVTSSRKVKLHVSVPGTVSVDDETISFKRRNQTLQISFEVKEKPAPVESAKSDADKIKPCYVRLERISLPVENVPKTVDTNEQEQTDSEAEMEQLVLLSSDEEECEPAVPTVASSCSSPEIRISPSWLGTCSLSNVSPSKKKRLCLTVSPPKSPKEMRDSRRERRKIRKAYRGLNVGEMQLMMHSQLLKNDERHPRKGPDKIWSDDSSDDSNMKSFYNMTLPSCDDTIVESQPASSPTAMEQQSQHGDDDSAGATALSLLPLLRSQWTAPNGRRMVLIEPALPPPPAEELIEVDTQPSILEDAEVENRQQARAVVEENHLVVMHVEVLAVNRGKLLPDPEMDPVCCIFYHIHGDRGRSISTGVIPVDHKDCSVNAILSPQYKAKCKTVETVADEGEALAKLTHIVQHENPDILMGYEIEMDSWGYLVQRASRIGLNLPNLLSRVPKVENHEVRQAQSSQGAIAEFSDLKICGRIVLNLWRLLKHEIALQDYSLESIAFHLLHRRLPHFPLTQLLAWWAEPKRCFLVTDYMLSRLAAYQQLLDSLDMLGRTSELARLFGIQFYEVFSRGSQFRVESMMLRLAKPKNFVPVSPSVNQRAVMRAPEVIPLVMEPQSTFYTDPVAVLDFQSLYPSVIISHNLCFSTCLGRVEFLGKEEPFEFGCSLLKVNPHKLKSIGPYISPNGVAFIPKRVRQGILPAMLAEILNTRLMVKQSLKQNKNDEILAKVLHARQLGLKLIANVTYGYTAANFSGRMPCIEVGDSVVAKGREILERAIRMVNENFEKWGGEVVYGDTDSMFVLFKGKTREEAFDIAEQIAETVTHDNPSPVKLKMEKVYQPCILQTKKRYVGYMYESKNQAEPVYEAKGIETVRRDGCPAVSKLLEKCLRILFSTKNVNLVKKHTVDYFQQVLLGTVSLQDFIFAKEFRGLSGYRPGACVPALVLARQWVQVDRRAEPRQGQRVPYVIISGAPGLPLIRLVRCPRQVLEDPALRLNAEYYLSRALVPPLARCFCLLGVDVASWLAEMPRRTVVGATGKGSIAHFFTSVECAVCRQLTTKHVCADCRSKPQMAVLKLNELVRAKERTRQKIDAICGSCCGRQFDLECDSLACPVMYRRRREALDDQLPKLRQSLQDLSF